MQSNTTHIAIHNPIAILEQSRNRHAIGVRDLPEYIEQARDPGRLRSPIALGFHDHARIAAFLQSGPKKQHKDNDPNAILNSFTRSFRNPIATEAEEIAKGYKELE